MVDHLILVPLSAAIADSSGLPLEKSGLLIAVYPFASASSAFFFAPFSDRWGRKRMLVLLCSGFALATLGFAFSETVPSLFFFRILSGVFGGPILPNSIAFAGDRFTDQRRSRAFTTLMLTFSVASVMGVPIGAWLGDSFDWQTPFLGIAVISGFVSLFLWRLPHIQTGAESGDIASQYKELLQLWTVSRIRSVFILQFLMLFGLFGVVPNLSVWFSVNYLMSATAIGICYMQGGVGGILGNQISGYLLQRGHRSFLLISGSLIMGSLLFFLTLELLPGAWLGVVFAGLMFGGSFRMPALQSVLVELTDIDFRGRLMAMSMIVNNLTMGIGGVWSTFLLKLEDGHLYGMSTIGAVALLTLSLAALWVPRTLKQVLTPSPPST